MRTIRKRASPLELDEWRQDRKDRNDPALYPFDYEAMRRSENVLEKVEDGVFREQGGICAYTGRKISRFNRFEQADFHLEHIRPQCHCKDEWVTLDTSYHNLLACWPAPNQKQATKYGAVKKDDWPSPAEIGQFVSPLDAACSARFRFITKPDPPENEGAEVNYSNWIESSDPSDSQAAETIKRIGLNHGELRALRHEAIIGTLNPTEDHYLNLEELRQGSTHLARTEADLNDGAEKILTPFCFAISQAIDQRIERLSGG